MKKVLIKKQGVTTNQASFATDASPTTTFTTSTARNLLSIHKVGL